MDNIMIAFIIFLVTIFISRMISEKASKKLDQDKKAALVDVFSNDRIWTAGILIVIVILFFVSLKYDLMDPFWTYILYILSLAVYIIIVSFNAYKKLKANDFPDFYIQSYITSTALRLVGVIILVVLLNYT